MRARPQPWWDALAGAGVALLAVLGWSAVIILFGD
jgi:hypothetical protein